MPKRSRTNMQTDLGDKARGITPQRLRNHLAARIHSATGIKMEQLLDRICRFPSSLDNKSGVLYKTQKPFVDALLKAVEEMEPCYAPICADLRAKITYTGRKKVDRAGSWITAALAGIPVYFQAAYDGPGMYRFYLEETVGEEEEILDDDTDEVEDV